MVVTKMKHIATGHATSRSVAVTATARTWDAVTGIYTSHHSLPIMKTRVAIGGSCMYHGILYSAIRCRFPLIHFWTVFSK